MKNKTLSVRLNPIDMARLAELAQMRSEMAYKSNPQEYMLKSLETPSEIIRHAILRMYNETLEYLIYEREDFIQDKDR